MRSFIPNSLTLLNLFCGLQGIVFSFNMGLTEAFYMIVLASIFDFFDGFSARLLKVKSALGAQLDSLADMVTFGVLPGIMLFQYISITQGNYFTPIYQREASQVILALVGFLVPLFSALRLAKFNISTNQTHHFIGLPTPANAILIGSLGFIMEIQFNLNYYMPLSAQQLGAVTRLNFYSFYEFFAVLGFFKTNFHLLLSVVSAFLLVAPVKLFSLKLKSLKFEDNKLFYSYLILMVCLLLLNFVPYFFSLKGWIKYWPTFNYLLIPLAIVFYIIISIIGYRSFKHEI